MNCGTNHLVLVADSRAWRFDHYKIEKLKNTDYHYIIKRGATIESLQRQLFDLLEGHKIPYGAPLVIKIALGINNIVYKKQDSLEHGSTEGVLDKLLEFRTTIHIIRPEAVVSFITIAPAIVRFDQLQKHLSEIEAVNQDLIRSNASCWQGIFAHTPNWHTDVTCTVKRRRRSGTYKTYRDIRRTKLYDGLHAKSDVKKIWFEKWQKSAEIDFENIWIAREIRY